MSKLGKELIESMQQAAQHSHGRKIRGMRVTAVEVPDVKAIRAKLHMSQQRKPNKDESAFGNQARSASFSTGSGGAGGER